MKCLPVILHLVGRFEGDSSEGQTKYNVIKDIHFLRVSDLGWKSAPHQHDTSTGMLF